MDSFTTRNTVIAALAQVGVVVAGVLAAGACHKWYTTLSIKPPPATAFAAEYGFAALALPVAWVALALRAQRRGQDSALPASLVLPSGVALLLLLLLGVGWAAVCPFLRLILG